MGGPSYRSLNDFVRHGVNIALTCSYPHCQHEAVADSWQVVCWSRLWCWPDSLEADVARHFRCSKCRTRRPGMRPTERPVTLLDFFPANENAWKRLRQRIRR